MYKAKNGKWYSGSKDQVKKYQEMAEKSRKSIAEKYGVSSDVKIHIKSSQVRARKV